MIEKAGEVEIYFAEYKNKVLAAGLYYFYGDTCYYVHGASSSQNRPVMAPYLLHWQIIKTAKARGKKYYNWGGFTFSQNPRHSWFGISRFKKGFGGQPLTYLGTWDFIFSPSWYRVYKLVRTINRSIKKYSNNYG